MSTSKVFYVTGASSGIGRATTEYLTKRGHKVFATARSDKDLAALNQLANVTAVRLDLNNEDTIWEAAEFIKNKLEEQQIRGLDGLINNAGIVVGSPLETLPLARLRTQLEVNLVGLLGVTQSVIPLLRSAGGRIVNIGSISGHVTTPIMGPYCMSKHALVALSDALRLELLPWNLHVALIDAGPVKSEIWEKGSQQIDDVIKSLTPEQRELYLDYVQKMAEILGRKKDAAIPIEMMTETIGHAVLSPKPKARYTVGRVAKIGTFLKWLLPRSWMDKLIKRVH